MEATETSCSYSNGILTVRIKGDIDHHLARHLREETDKAIFYYRPSHCIIDLSEVDFMDSSGLGFILGRFSCMKESNGTLEIVGASTRTAKILSLAGADKLICINKNSCKN